MMLDKLCRTCGRSFKGGPRAYYCPECREIRRMERDRFHKRNGPARPLGSMDRCERCGNEYIVNSGLQRFCPKCKPEHYKEYDRETGLEFYHEHKERINPIRNPRRRQGAVKCEWCGEEFISHTCTKTCSPECRRELKNKKWRERYYQKKAETEDVK